MTSSVAVAAVLCLLPIPVPAAQSPSDLELTAYVLRTFDGREHEAELGRLRVPASRRSPGAGTIRLAFVRLRSRAPRPAHPIVFLSGGPGVPGVGIAQVPVYFALFDRLRDAADVILLDQRGTGLSEPSLSCPPADLPANLFEDRAAATAALAGAARRCAEHWRAEGVDLASYTTSESAADVSDLTRALGAERVSLLAWSYGTELALEVLRRHPERVDRVVFASTRGPDRMLKLAGAWDAQLRRLSILAPADQSLTALLEQATRRLAQNPARIEVADRRTGRVVDLRVGGLGLQLALRGMLNDGRMIPIVPALIATAARGDYELLGAALAPLYNGLAGGLSAMQLAVDCSSGGSAERRAQAAREAEGALFDALNLQWDPSVCAAVGAAAPDAARWRRVWSEAPALFLSGSLDGNAPAFEAEEVRMGFPNGVHLVVENAGHESLPAPEVQAVVADFFASADVSGRAPRLPAPQFLSVDEAKARLAAPPGPPPGAPR